MVPLVHHRPCDRAEPNSPNRHVRADRMRFVDDEGRTWTVRDVALLPERALVEPGHARAVERYFVNPLDEKRVYHFTEDETRWPRPEQLARQLRAAHPFTPQRQSDPNLYRV